MSFRTGSLILLALTIGVNVIDNVLGDWIWIAYALCALWILTMLILNKRKHGKFFTSYWGGG